MPAPECPRSLPPSISRRSASTGRRRRLALSLVEAFAEIPDPRHARGIRHGVLAIVLLGACAVLTGARSFAAIAEYAHDTGRAILDLLGVGTVVPHASTIRRVLQDLDPDAVEAAMRTWVPARSRPNLPRRPAPDVPGLVELEVAVPHLSPAVR